MQPDPAIPRICAMLYLTIPEGIPMLKRVWTHTYRILALLIAASFTTAAASSKIPDVTDDGLHRIPDSDVTAVFTLPEADFSQYKKLMMLDAEVSFRRGWEREQRYSSYNRVSKRDIQQIKDSAAKKLREVFMQVLQEEGGYQFVNEPDYDVLLLRPSLVNLDIKAPVTQSSTRISTYSSSAGSVSLVLELNDSVTGQLLARAMDKEKARRGREFQLTTSVQNNRESERIFRKWAELLRQGLDDVHGK